MKAGIVRVGLISDTHIPESRAELWPEAIAALAGVDLIIHAGDVYETGVIDRLGEVAPTYVALGNGDYTLSCAEEGGDVRIRRTWLLEVGGLRIGAVHGLPMRGWSPAPGLEATLERLFGRRSLDVLVYGDTHVEAIDKVGATLCVNPGSPTFPHNLDVRLGTVALLEIAGGRAEATIWQLTPGGRRHLP